jgi:hypothetical protein
LNLTPFVSRFFTLLWHQGRVRIDLQSSRAQVLTGTEIAVRAFASDEPGTFTS